MKKEIKLKGRTLSRSKFDVPNSLWNANQFQDDIIDSISLKSAEQRGRKKADTINKNDIKYTGLRRSETEYDPSVRSSNHSMNGS